MSRASLLDLSPVELEGLAEHTGAPRYRGRQLARWIFQKGVSELDAMSDLPRGFRAALEPAFEARFPEIERTIASIDGSRKFVLRLGDGARVQAVLIPDEDRLTVCLSTQVGCGLACAFCLTGTMGLERNLTSGEIVGQVAAVRATLAPGQRLTHVVYMGMGEPLANYEATVKSLRILTDPHGLAISPRRITVSTVGLANGLRRLGSEGLRVNLAISLHATTDDLRSRLLPVNRRFAIEELLSVCRGFPLPLRQRITFEYVLLDGVNDSREDALRLAALLRGIRAKVNLIPFNDWPGSAFRRPMLPRILGFQSALLQRGITATVRWSKGVDIGAACGQLKETVPA
jgi:23S rRNA (adenine2503-C2)-methyltransferase